MPTEVEKIEANEQNLRQKQIQLINLITLSNQEADEVKAITGGITDEGPLIAEALEKVAAAFALLEEIRKRHGFLNGMIQEVDEAEGTRQKHLAKILTAVDPKVAAMTPGALQDLLYLAGGEIMMAAFGPDSWVPLEKRLMMLATLSDLVELQQNKIEAENGD